MKKYYKHFFPKGKLYDKHFLSTRVRNIQLSRTAGDSVENAVKHFSTSIKFSQMIFCRSTFYGLVLFKLRENLKLTTNSKQTITQKLNKSGDMKLSASETTPKWD